MAVRHHALKTWPEPFRAIIENPNCRKTHEIRKNDRDFQVGDVLLLREYDPEDGTYSGRNCCVVVTYITRGGTWGLPDDLCVMSIRLSSVKLTD